MTPFNLATMSEDIATSKVLEGKAIKHHDLPQKLDPVVEEPTNRIVRAPRKSQSPKRRGGDTNKSSGSGKLSTVPTPRDARAAPARGSPGPPPMILKAGGGGKRASGPPITIKRRAKGDGSSPSGSTAYTVSSQRRASVERHHSNVDMSSLKPSKLPSVTKNGVGASGGSGHVQDHGSGSSSKYEHMDAKRKRHEERRARKEDAQRRVHRRGGRRGDGERKLAPRVRHPREVEQHTNSHPANRSLSVMKPRRGPQRTYKGSDRHGGDRSMRGAQSESVLPTLPNIGSSRNMGGGRGGKPTLAKRGSNRALHSESVAST